MYLEADIFEGATFLERRYTREEELRERVHLTDAIGVIRSWCSLLCFVHELINSNNREVIITMIRDTHHHDHTVLHEDVGDALFVDVVVDAED